MVDNPQMQKILQDRLGRLWIPDPPVQSAEQEAADLEQTNVRDFFQDEDDILP